MSKIYCDRIVNSVQPHQNTSLGGISSWSSLFVLACLIKYFGKIFRSRTLLFADVCPKLRSVLSDLSLD